jgi:hypothetical protein
MGLEATANLLVAALDLKLVELLRGAMRAADITADKSRVQAAVIRPRPVLHPQPRFEPRRVVHPTPRFLPRTVLHPVSRLEPQPASTPSEPERSCRCGHGLPPPWKMPVWNLPIAPKVTIKRVVQRTDVHHKGSLLDLFI